MSTNKTALPGKEGKELDGPQTTKRECKAMLLNNWDVTITDITFRHSSGEDYDKLTISSLMPTQQSEALTIHYETGFGAPHDYWWVMFTAQDGEEPGVWTCKDNFYCDLRASDEDTLVQVQVSVGDTDMYVTESSGQCYVSLDKM